MNTYSKVALALLGVMLPFSLALAKDGGSNSQSDDHASISVQGHLELGDDNINSNADVEVRGNAEPGEHGQKEGLEKHFSTTTPPGFWEDHSSSTREHGTSTEDKGEGKHGNFISAFINWILGLPDTTTVGDIKAQLQASSTASTTLQGEHQGMGFWAKLFSFLHL